MHCHVPAESDRLEERVSENPQSIGRLIRLSQPVGMDGVSSNSSSSSFNPRLLLG